MSPVKVSGLNKITACLRETAKIHEGLAHTDAGRILKAASLIIQAIRSGHKIIWIGNGGSASQAQHMAAELVGRFTKERRAFASISLSENMASVTAIANDYGYERLFVRQLEGIAKSGDVIVGLSASGKSPNVLMALQQARKLGLKSIGLTGKQGIPMKNLCDVCIMVPSTVTARIQEAHLSIGHLLCNLAEDTLA